MHVSLTRLVTRFGRLTFAKDEKIIRASHEISLSMCVLSETVSLSGTTSSFAGNYGTRFIRACRKFVRH